ncbi:MAG: bifunctional diaminohydroxyphosphoribosylaminopyrimidine deaminase/5-amino-6-(5-phosphoribosylamino)uracil reductase RibD [Chthonomonadales bacterium]
MDFTPDDIVFMSRALELAGKGFTHPNPMVGCVLVKDGRIIGEGYHHQAGMPHAEVEAIRSATESVARATAYVTLEPCSHFGRTPPCALALQEVGVSRVVCASVDPNPKVSGQGIASLRSSGIQVEVGLLEAECTRLNEAIFHFQKTGLPFVTLKCATTLDGKTATATGDSRWITGDESRANVHLERARSGAVLVGVGTAIADDPMLDARLDPKPDIQPTRIILDPNLRLPLSSRLVLSAREIPVIVVTGASALSERQVALEVAGVAVVRVECKAHSGLDLHEVKRLLAIRGINSIYVEGGGKTHAAFLNSGVADRVSWYIAPKIVGGASAPTGVEGVGIERMADALELHSVETKTFGKDLLITGLLGHTDSTA